MLSAELQIKLKNFFSTQPVVKAYIFGSYARNEENAESDLDILVELDENKKVSLFDFANMQITISDKLQMKIDLVSHRGLSPYIGPYIHSEKKLIYEA